VQPTESAVLVRIPEAEPLVGRFRADLDVAASLGVPAHVTVIFPFVAPDLIDDAVIGALAEAVGSVSAFTATFKRVAWFERTVMWLAPEPAEPFLALTNAVWQRFPSCPPYGGVHQHVVPHLTVGIDHPADVLESAARAVEPGLPITGSVTAAVLMRGSNEPRSWGVVAELPLMPGAAPPR
jgi:2'-5' RNA ligase